MPLHAVTYRHIPLHAVIHTAQVDIHEAEAELAIVRIQAKAPASAESLWWQTLFAAVDGEVCGAAVPTPADVQGALTESALGEVRRAAKAQVVALPGVLLAAGAGARLHVAMLLLLRDLLRTEASARYDAYSFVAHAATRTAVAGAVRNLGRNLAPDATPPTRLLLLPPPSAGGETPRELVLWSEGPELPAAG